MSGLLKNQNAVVNGNIINAAEAKTTPVDADMVGLMDSADSNIFKKLSWANIKATMKAYFATLQTVTVSEGNDFGAYGGTARQGSSVALEASSTYLITASVYQAAGNAGLTYLALNLSNSSATLSVAAWGAIGRTYSYQNCAATDAMFATLGTTRTTTTSETLYLNYQVNATTATSARTYFTMTATKLK